MHVVGTDNNTNTCSSKLFFLFNIFENYGLTEMLLNQEIYLFSIDTFTPTGHSL